MAPGAQTSTTGGGAATAKGILILVLLVVLAGAGGYFFGTYQKFAPIQNVAPGTPGAVGEVAGGTGQTPASQTAPSTLQKKYWIHSRGNEHVGYAITISVNGQLVDKIYNPGKDVEITRFVKPGENQVAFQAKCLPASMRMGAQDYYELDVDVIANKMGPGHDYSSSDVLLTYSRKANETEDYNDNLTFVTLE